MQISETPSNIITSSRSCNQILSSNNFCEDILYEKRAFQKSDTLHRSCNVYITSSSYG